MSVEIRPAADGEMQEMARIVSLSLAIPSDQFAALRPEWTLCAFEDGRLATAYAAWPFTIRLNGRPMPVAAVTTVSTNPLYRRRGNLRSIMETDFRRRHEQGEPLAALYASLAAIYQRYGYAVVSTHHRYTVEPRFLQFTTPQAVPGRLREASPDELGTLVDVYRRFREERNGYLHRGAAMWHAGVLAPPAKDATLSIVVYEEDEAPQGYLAYVTGPGAYPGPGVTQTLQLRELCWLTPAAYRAFWEHLGRFDLVREIVWPVVAPDDPLTHLLLEPRMLQDSSRDGILARVIDVDRAFSGRGYDREADIRFAVVDQLCPWNEGTWELQASPSEAIVKRSSAAPDFTTPVSTLAMLVFGQVSASQALRMGRLETERPERLLDCDVLLSTRYRPFCPDHF